MPSTVRLLQAYKKQVQSNHPNTILKEAFLFPSASDLFSPRDPNSVTRRVKRFMKNNGLPDLSPHDLRHSCATLLLSPRCGHQERTGDSRTRRRKHHTELLRQGRLAADESGNRKVCRRIQSITS